MCLVPSSFSVFLLHPVPRSSIYIPLHQDMKLKQTAIGENGWDARWTLPNNAWAMPTIPGQSSVLQPAAMKILCLGIPMLQRRFQWCAALKIWQQTGEGPCMEMPKETIIWKLQNTSRIQIHWAFSETDLRGGAIKQKFVQLLCSV